MSIAIVHDAEALANDPQRFTLTLPRPAKEKGTFYISLAYGDRQDLRGNLADQGAATCDLNAIGRPGQLLTLECQDNGKQRR
jgi:hypothetical protein